MTSSSDKERAICDCVPEERILAPIPRPFTWRGRTFALLPLPDAALMHIGEALASVTSLLDALAGQEGMEGGRVLPPLALLPDLLRALLPRQSQIVAAALGVTEREVRDRMPLAKKLEALRLVLEAEEMPALLSWQKRQPPPKPLRPPKKGEAKSSAEPLTRGGLYELFSSEYGWTPGYVASMPFLLQNLYLTRLVARKKREAGPGAGGDEDDWETVEIVSGEDLRAFMG